MYNTGKKMGLNWSLMWSRSLFIMITQKLTQTPNLLKKHWKPSMGNLKELKTNNSNETHSKQATL